MPMAWDIVDSDVSGPALDVGEVSKLEIVNVLSVGAAQTPSRGDLTKLLSRRLIMRLRAPSAAACSNRPNVKLRNGTVVMAGSRCGLDRRCPELRRWNRDILGEATGLPASERFTPFETWVGRSSERSAPR